jgi:hypothetical protein
VEHDNSSARTAANVALNERSGSFSIPTKNAGTDRRRRWTFVMNDDGTWGWHVVKPDGTEETSTRAFKKLAECTEDATRHGYVVWQQQERRDSELRWQQCIQFEAEED